MGELRWILLLAGLSVLAGVYIYTRYARSRAAAPAPRREPVLGDPPTEPDQPSSPAPTAATDEPSLSAPPADRVVALRLIAREREGFPGEELVLALREAGLRHGEFGIFHAHAGDETAPVQFSVASLVEPGSFELSGLKETRYPGVSIFMGLPSAGEAVEDFDRMMLTSRELVRKLDGDLLDEQGSSLSIQRERYLREEVLQYMHRVAELAAP